MIFLTPSSSPVGRKQERSMNVPEAHPYECNKIIPLLLSRIQKLETLVISLMSVTNRDHSHLASNEIKIDNEGFSTLIRLSPDFLMN